MVALLFYTENQECLFFYLITANLGKYSKNLNPNRIRQLGSYDEHNLEQRDTYAIIAMNIIECDLLLGKEEEAKDAIYEIAGLLKKEDSDILTCILMSNEIVFYAKQRDYEKTKKLINAMLEHLYYSQIEEYSKKYIESDDMCVTIMKKHIKEYESFHNMLSSSLRAMYNTAFKERNMANSNSTVAN